mmetsp:Transcript_2486/g.5918  ORF Transcript_2486/g.5918 Transcript_2486/m.5918 type:complete len:216 (-) Transcript_2486:169-816(-)
MRIMNAALCLCCALAISRERDAALNCIDCLNFLVSPSSETLQSSLGTSSVSMLDSTLWLAISSISRTPRGPLTAMTSGRMGSTTPGGQWTANPGEILRELLEMGRLCVTTLPTAPSGLFPAMAPCRPLEPALSAERGLEEVPAAVPAAPLAEASGWGPPPLSVLSPSADCTAFRSMRRRRPTRIGFIICASSRSLRSWASLRLRWQSRGVASAKP